MPSYLQTIEQVYEAAAGAADADLCCTRSPLWHLPDLHLPQAMLEMNYGCGSTVDPRDLRRDDTILYVGVGGGLEALQFAYFTRRPDSVLAVDPVAAMRDKARANFEEAAGLNPWFRPEFITLLDGSALDLPILGSSVTVVAQNCLFNVFTAEDLTRALAEVVRVLKPGGLFSTSDPITPQPLPAELSADLVARARCLAGCQTLPAYLQALTGAGLGRVEVRNRIPYRYLHPREYPALQAPVLLESVEVAAYKIPAGPDGSAVFTGRTAIYTGPEPAWDDGCGHVLRRGIPVAVSDAAAQRLARRMDVVLTEPTYHCKGAADVAEVIDRFVQRSIEHAVERRRLSLLTINDTAIEDTFAEAFPMTAARLIVTAETPAWAQTAGLTTTGYATSVIGCDAEAGIERTLAPEETPDGRPGVSLLLFAFSRDALQKALINRVGQCVLTCPTTACYNGLPMVKDRAVRIGGNLRFFGDGFQFSKKLEGRRFWRLPVMEGEFLCEDFFGTVKGVAGGNFLMLGRSPQETLAAAEAAVAAVRQLPGVLLPFPGGVVRSGSKVGSRYKKLRASTNDAYCPSLRGLVRSALPEGVNAVYEIVIDGLDQATVEEAMRVGVRAACVPGVVQITAGNYGGKLGPFHFHLHKLLDRR